MKTVKCEICGAEFETARPNKKYCSFSCKQAGQTLHRLKWKDANPGYMREYMRAYKARKGSK